MGATGPVWLPPRPGPTWPRSWRSSPKSPLTTQVLMLRFLANVCLPQRFRPAKPHPKPFNVSWGELFNVSPLTLLLRGTVGRDSLGSLERQGSVMGVCVQRLENHFTDVVYPRMSTSSITSKEGPTE